jgi:hypothetical protein
LAVAIGLVTAVIVVPEAHTHGKPVRSGRIVVAARSNGLLGPLPGCWGSPDCLVWRQTCREPVLREGLGLSSSIVDVGKLAGSSKTRTFEVVERHDASIGWGGGATIEFWDASCDPVPRFSPYQDELIGVSCAGFKIPKRARWMTVTSGQGWLATAFGGVDLRWELR